MIIINSNNDKKFCFHYYFNDQNLCLNINKKFIISNIQYEYLKNLALEFKVFFMEYK